jgi:hypothetical protein
MNPELECNIALWLAVLLPFILVRWRRGLGFGISVIASWSLIFWSFYLSDAFLTGDDARSNGLAKGVWLVAGWFFSLAWSGIAWMVATLVVIACRYVSQNGWRFSLRTLLIATTLVAVVLGLIDYAARK